MFQIKSTTIFAIIFLLISCAGLFAQTNPMVAEADELAQSGEYEKAEALYKKAQQDESSSRIATFKLAAMYHTNKKYDEAIAEYSKLESNGNPIVLYNLAAAYSMKGEKNTALDYLEKSVDRGFSQLAAVNSDPDMDNIRNDERFEKIIRSIKVLENFPEAEKFNFWVGEWNVFNPQNKQVGESKIEKILKDVVILENWFGGNGYVGKSFNHFNMDKKKWAQYWVDQNSVPVYFEGNWDDSQNALVFFSYDHSQDESPYIRRLTFFDLAPDTVRQFSERSTDNGGTWFTEYDFTYVRKKE